MRDGANTRRTATVLAGFALLASVSFAATSVAQDANGRGPEASAAVEPTTVSAAIRGASQQQILSSGRVRARVASAVAGTMRVKAKVRSASSPRATRIAKVKRLRFGAPISRRVSLRLTSGGRAALASCEAKELIVRVKLAGAGAQGRGIATQQLTLDSGACTQTPPGTIPPGANNAPAAVADSGATGEDAVLNVPAPGVLTNDTDPDAGDTKAVGEVNGSAANVGVAQTTAKGASVTLNANGSYSYDPTGSATLQALAAASSTTDTFTYRVKDGSNAFSSSTATVTITVNGAADGNVVPPPTNYTGPAIPTTNSARCDWLDNHGGGDPVCLQPWPNNYFTKADDPTGLTAPNTDTDKLLNLNVLSMPANKAGKPIDPTEHNLNDGFSPGNMIITKVPGLNSLEAFENTGAVGIDTPDAYDDVNQPIVVINADTGERHPVWSEIDFNPLDPAVCGNAPKPPCEPESVNLIIRPLENFEEGERYIVALRRLKDANGDTIQPSNGFRVYRDNLINTGQPEVEARRAHFEDLFEELGDADQVVDRADLYLAWDFTVASERNLSERALNIRDDAFGGPAGLPAVPGLGDTNLADLTVQGDSPTFTINPGSPTNFTVAQNPRIARRIEGQITDIPCYLDTPGCPPGSRFAFLPGQSVPTGLPGNTTTASFTCDIPRSATGANKARPSLYGHGLLGSGTEVTGGNIQAMASENNFMHCATDWAGFATTDIGTVLLSLQDLSFFGAATDRMQQGFVNMMYLGRAMIHPSGFSSDDAFKDVPAGQSLIDTQRLFYDGNSQGGIMGGALTALSPDFERAVLGVPGINYSTLLTRSVDFEPYAEGQFGEVIEDEICSQFPDPPAELPDEIEGPLSDLRDQVEDLCVGGVPDDTELGLYDNYPNKLERPMIFSIMQLLWDRGEGNGYAHHMTTDPLDSDEDYSSGTPPHTVLLHPAFGDHQVANVAAEVEARTIGASVYQPALDPGRHWEADGSAEIFDIPAIASFPFGGSALVYWDGGPVLPSNPSGTATPPNEDIPPRPPIFGSDPHSYPRNDVKGRAQKAAFLAVGGVVQNPCRTVNNTLTTPPSGPSAVVFSGGMVTPCYSHGWTGP
jgi:VCBS repeat-containing protein